MQHDRAEMEVLFSLLAERYKRKSVMITSNLVFSKWDQIFKDPMTTAAAIDRVVDHSIVSPDPVSERKPPNNALRWPSGPQLKWDHYESSLSTHMSFCRPMGARLTCGRDRRDSQKSGRNECRDGQI